MIGLVIAIHVTICALLIIIILIQAGRGGGLVEGFSGVESMFGPKTSAFLTKTTSVLSTMFFITCIGLAFLSAQQSKSLMSQTRSKAAIKETTAKTTNTEQAETSTAQTPAPATTQAPVATPAQTQDAAKAK